MPSESNLKTWIRILKWVIAVLVIAGVIYMLRNVTRDMRTSELDLREIRWPWFFLSVALYGLGTVPGGIFWYQVLIALGQRPKLGRALRAFFFSQLGKYVPGKAMVIVMRSTMVSGPAVRPSIAVTSVFVETLTWMAVGSVIGSLLLAILNPQQLWLVAIGIGFALCALVAISPVVLGRVLKRLARWKNADAAVGDFGPLSIAVIARGWLYMLVGWLLVAASMWAVLQAVPGPAATGSHFLLALECVTLSIVIGVASLIPGGLGVRELVIVPLLTPEFGAAKAFACAILVRIVWFVAEASIVAIIQIGDGIRAARSN